MMHDEDIVSPSNPWQVNCYAVRAKTASEHNTTI